MNRWIRNVALVLSMAISANVGAPALFAQDDQTAEAKKSDSKSVKKDKKSKEDVEAIGDRDVGKGMNFYSLEKEIALGKTLAQQVEQQSRIINDPVISEYVNRVGQNIVRNSDAQVPFTIKVLDSDEVNAFALPGGFFFVNTGLIREAETESELAGVMAHEIAHVAARHGTKNASKAELANWMSLPLIFLGGPIGYGVRSAAGLLLPLKFLQFSRGAEREADYLGLQYLYKSGYDPKSYVDFFEKIQSKEKNRPGSLAKAFSTHPPTPDRIEAAQVEIKTILPNKDEYLVTSSEFNVVSDRLKMLQNRGRIEEGADQSGKPTLRKKTTQPPSDTKDSKDGKTTGGDTTSDSTDDSRPTLKRR